MVLFASAAISLSRILALYDNYSAPIDVYRKAFDLVQVPTLLAAEPPSDATAAVVDSATTITMETLMQEDRKPARSGPVRVCVGKEWYRFPSHYFLPEGARLGLIKSHFDGLLPGEFSEKVSLDAINEEPELKPSAAEGKHHRPMMKIDWRWSAERRPGTSYVPKQMNNQNKEVWDHYVSHVLLLTCSCPHESDVY